MNKDYSIIVSGDKVILDSIENLTIEDLQFEKMKVWEGFNDLIDKKRAENLIELDEYDKSIVPFEDQQSLKANAPEKFFPGHSPT